MGRLILQMMISVDGIVSGPEGALDWIAHDDVLEQEHLARIKEARVVIMGAGLYPSMPDFWEATAKDENASALSRATGQAVTDTPKIVYSHEDKPAGPNAEVRIIKDDTALIEDIQRLKQETDGMIVSYGGVRFARSLMQHDLLDELHLDICPVILGKGEKLFTDIAHRTNLRLRETVTYNSGTTMVHYDVVKSS